MIAEKWVEPGDSLDLNRSEDLSSPRSSHDACTAPPIPAAQIRKWRRYLAEERLEGKTYRDLAKRKVGREKEILEGLALAEHRHEQHWMDLLGENAFPMPRPPVGTRVRSLLARLFGTIFVLAMAQRSEQRTSYDVDNDATAQMAADEHIHGEVLRALTTASRQKLSGTFRAAVFGINDGLVSNLALVLGVGATGMPPSLIAATGIAGLLAGALSMAAGEWLSVSSQTELLDASIPDPQTRHFIPALNVDTNELALVFRARGENEEDAIWHAQKVFEELDNSSQNTSESLPIGVLSSDGAHADMGAAQEVGTPFRAALTSFLFFAGGAVIPLIPLCFGLSASITMLLSLLLVGIALLFTGGVVGILSGKSPGRRACRQLAIGWGASAITYLLGLAFGASGIG